MHQDILSEIENMEDKNHIIDEFLSTWEKNADLIKENAIPPDQLRKLLDLYTSNANLLISIYCKPEDDDYLDMTSKISIITFSKLAMASSISMSRWKRENPGLIEKIISKSGPLNFNVGINLPSSK